MNIQVGIITVSDRAAAGQYEDFGGPLVAKAADGYGWSVIAETVAANKGVGNLMLIASSSFNVPLVFAGLMVLAVMGVSLYAVFSVVERRVASWALRKDI